MPELGLPERAFRLVFYVLSKHNVSQGDYSFCRGLVGTTLKGYAAEEC